LEYNYKQKTNKIMAELEVVEVFPRLIVGLGNPGAKYDRTRHNIGFDLIDQLAKRWQMPVSEQKRFQGQVGEGWINRQKIVLLKPQTFMNLSGQSVRSVLDWYKLEPSQVLVLYDDLDLPLGKLRMRLAGSAGGHNGMKSIISHMGTPTFPRLRMGIGKSQDETISHVLGKFSVAESSIIGEVLQLAADAVELSVGAGVEKSMNKYNNRSVLLAVDPLPKSQDKPLIEVPPVQK
jgi:peptidyl-tRNA hydrolase, PTH1 family